MSMPTRGILCLGFLHHLLEFHQIRENSAMESSGWPVRISTIRKADGLTVKTLLQIEQLLPAGDIVGESARGARMLVAQDSELEGQEPYLQNAICGLFAIVSFRFQGSPDATITSRIAWNPTHDIMMSIGFED